MIRNLLPKVGFGWTVRAMALVALGLLGCANIVLRTPQMPKRRRRLLDVASLKDWPYVCFVLGCFCLFLGMYTPFYYVQAFAMDSGMTTEGIALYIVTAMNVSSIPGRILPALFAQHLGPLNLIIGTILGLTACGFGFIGADDVAKVYVVAVFYGFFSGCFFALQPTVFARLTSNMAALGTRFGMAFTVMSVALLVGSPIGGAVQGPGPGGYVASWVWSGATIFTGSLIICAGKVLKAGWNPLVRV